MLSIIILVFLYSIAIVLLQLALKNLRKKKVVNTKQPETMISKEDMISGWGKEEEDAKH